MPDPKAGSYKINFDPLMMADGIEATNDPILLFRSPSYAVKAAMPDKHPEQIRITVEY
jgi:catalase